MQRLSEPIKLVLTVLLHLIILVAVVQAWMSGWPGRWWLTFGALIPIGLSVLVWRRSKTGPLLIAIIAAAALFLATALLYGSTGAGLRIAGLPFELASAVLVIAGIALVAWQFFRLASSPRLPRWVRFIPVAVAAYAIALIVLGIVRGNAADAIAGDGPVPWWISGGYLGSAILLPLGVIAALAALVIALIKKRPGKLIGATVLLLLFTAFALSGMELTRRGRANLAQYVVPASLLGGAGAFASTGGEASSSALTLGPGDEALAPFAGKDLDEIFTRVATGVRYEPYRGILRGAMGTAVARSGNSADQSMLLAELLRRAGYRVRLARGQLAEPNIDVVIRGMYPPRFAQVQLAADLDPYNPAADTALRELVREHVWVEVFQGESWLPLDPSFPRANIGDAHATPAEQFDEPPETLYQRLDVVFREENAGGETRELGRFAGAVADLSFKPISLTVRAVPQMAAAQDAQQTGGPAAAIGGMGGALGGETEAPKEPPQQQPQERRREGVAYVRTLNVAGSPGAIARTTVLDANPQSALRRELVEFTIAVPGGAPRVVQRVLFEADDQRKQPADDRHYTISIVPGRVSHEFADHQTAVARNLIDPERLQDSAKRAASTRDERQAAAAVQQVSAINDLMSSVSGQLIALRFAAESDSLTRRVGDLNGLALAWATPRILITGVELRRGGGNRMDADVSLDLRLDEVNAYPYPGFPSRAAAVFQMARGVQESVIEGAVISAVTGRDGSVNTAAVMRMAQAQRVPMLVINASTRPTLPEVAPGVPVSCVRLMDEAIARGKEIVLPARAVPLAGDQQWGWWEVDPNSGTVIGVMQDGEHQGMVEHSVATSKIGANDDNGWILGAMVGSITTIGSISGLTLKYGRITPKLIKELEATLKAVLCACPEGAEVKASVGGGGVSVGNECYSKGMSAPKLEGGMGVKVSFCEAYNKGFKCSSGMILRALKFEGPVTVTESPPSAESGANIGCADVGG